MIHIISRTHSITRDSSPGLDDVQRELKRGARLREVQGAPVVVSFSITFAGGRVYGGRGREATTQPVTISLYRDKGINPRRVLEEADNRGGLRAALSYLATRRDDVESLSEIVSVEMLLTER